MTSVRNLFCPTAWWKFALALFVSAVAVSCDAQAHNNPGEPAMQCVRTQGADGKVIFSNICDQKIFIIYCGDLKYSKQRCGNGPNGGFYTHSRNLEPGQSYDEAIDGQYSFAACVGGISFGNDGEYTDEPNGNFTCLRR
jgi:hypothetical protein